MEEGKVSEKREYPSDKNEVVPEQESSSKRQVNSIQNHSNELEIR